MSDKKKILIVDDSRMIRKGLTEIFEASNDFEVVGEAVDGKEALAAIRKIQPDVVTLDVVMPKTDGWKVLSELKANPTTENIPVVMVTIVEDRPLGFSLGASEFLTKPVDRKLLSKALKRFLGKDKNRTVLIVEDDADTRETMVRFLTREGAHPIEAENGRIGLEKLAENQPALILLDLMMPEMDGFEFVERYRDNPDWHEIPIIVLTAKTLTKEDHSRLDGWVKELHSKGDNNIEQIMGTVCSLLPKDG